MNIKNFNAFLDRIRNDEGYKKMRDKAIEEACEHCINNGVMDDFLKDHKNDIKDFYFDSWDSEVTLLTYYIEKFDLEMSEKVKEMSNVGLPIEFIIKATGWSDDQILKAIEQK